MKRNPMNEGQARLYGRLDVCKEWLSFEENNVNRIYIHKEILKIEDALNVLDDVKHENKTNM